MHLVLWFFFGRRLSLSKLMDGYRVVIVDLLMPTQSDDPKDTSVFLDESVWSKVPLLFNGTVCHTCFHLFFLMCVIASCLKPHLWAIQALCVCFCVVSLGFVNYFCFCK